MTADTTALGTTLALRSGTPLKNRLAKSAMSERIAAAGGAPSENLVALYSRWSESGAALLITGNVMVDADAFGETGNVLVEDDRHLPGLKAWAQAARQNGTQVWMQINHPGRQSPRFLTKHPVAPSAVPMSGAGSQAFAKPRALEDAEIEKLIERFATTASVAERAGFNGVQIHAAHGYLISQFLSPRTNLREDRWGGSSENRRRFLVEIVKAVRAKTGPDFAVAVKLNSADFQKGGFSEEESMEVVRELVALGIDLLEISGGTYESAVMFEEAAPSRASTTQREAFFLEYAEKVRAQISGVPLMVTGGFRTRAGMDAALASGAVDLIGMARPFAVEPDLPKRLLEHETESARPVRLATRIKNLDSVIQGAWYQCQLERMGLGKQPDPSLSRWKAVAGYIMPRKKFPPVDPGLAS